MNHACMYIHKFPKYCNMKHVLTSVSWIKKHDAKSLVVRKILLIREVISSFEEKHFFGNQKLEKTIIMENDFHHTDTKHSQ